jgi:general secretion pathway protein M
VDAALQWWNERAPREKAVLALAGLLTALAITFLALIEPAFTGIGRLERALPAQRAQAAQLDALLAEVKSLKARPQVASISPTEARAALDKSVAAAGMKVTRTVPLADGDLQLTFSDVPYATWATWLAGVERELGARTISVTANATATAGHVDVEVALRLARR